MQTRTNLCIKRLLNIFKLQIILKNQNKLFRFSFQRPYSPYCCMKRVVFNFQCGLCNVSFCRECVRHLSVNDKHIDVSPLTNKRMQFTKDSAVYHCLLNCSYSSTFEDVRVLCHKNKMYLSELTESLFIMRERSSKLKKVELPG